MKFIDTYIYFYDEKGAVIRKPDELLQRIKGEVGKEVQTISDKIINYPDGSKYEGDIVNGLKHGKGKFVKGSNYSYEGDYVNDKK